MLFTISLFLCLSFTLAKIRGQQQQESVQLACPGGCPVLLESAKWTQLYPAWLSVNISVAESIVLFNGDQIWPEQRFSQLSINQLTNGDFWKPHEGLIPVEVESIYSETTTWKDLIIYPIEVQILKVNDRIVNAEGLKIGVIKAPSGEISLETLQIIPYALEPVLSPVMDTKPVEEKFGEQGFSTIEPGHTKNCEIYSVQNGLAFGFWVFAITSTIMIVCFATWQITERRRREFTRVVVQEDQMGLLSK